MKEVKYPTDHTEKVRYEVTDKYRACCYSGCTSSSFDRTKSKMESLLKLSSVGEYPIDRKHVRIVKITEIASMVYYGDKDTVMEHLIES